MRRALIAVLLLVPMYGAHADDSPENLVKYRQRIMSGQAAHMGAASMIAKGDISRPADIVAHTDALAALAKLTITLFPAGTGPDKVAKTDALPAIWTKQADFEAAAKKAEEATARLAEVAKTGDLAAIKLQVTAVGETCGGCHDDFRKED